jgi:hypothetical protein
VEKATLLARTTRGPEGGGGGLNRVHGDRPAEEKLSIRLINTIRGK